MIRNQDNEIDYIHYHDSNGKRYEITYVFNKGIELWELIIGYLFSKDGYSLKSKDDYMLKAKNQ